MGSAADRSSERTQTMRARTRHHPAGMTMIELMFAIVILAIALAATLACTQTGHVADTSAYDRTRSTEIGQRLMEEILPLSTDEILLLDEDAVATEGYLAKINVVSRGIGMVEIQVVTIRPTGNATAAEATAMTPEAFWSLNCAPSSRTRLVCLKADGI